MIAGRSLTGTSTRRHSTARRRLMVARPPEARTFLTQLHCPPSIGTRYHWPCQSAIPSGNRTMRPDRRPVTSRVIHRLGARPSAKTAAHRRANRRAAASARPPAYMARRRSSENGQLAIVPHLRSPSASLATPRAWTTGEKVPCRVPRAGCRCLTARAVVTGDHEPKPGSKDPTGPVRAAAGFEHRLACWEVNAMRSRAGRGPDGSLARLVRWLGLDRNPLRRGTDRVEAALRLVMIILLVVAVPAAAIAAGRWADHR